jgi:hypothetical protein
MNEEDIEPWTKEDMEAMLVAGYTPEYVSLMKWVVIHKHYMMTEILEYSWLNGATCALCHFHYDADQYDDDNEACNGCTLYEQMGITCNDEGHPYIPARFGRIDDIISSMESMIVELVKLVAKHGVRVKQL